MGRGSREGVDLMTRLVALLLTVLTGFSGLTYEVAWEKYLATLLGSHSEAVAAVLGIFLGGLSVGYWLFGTVTRRLVSRAEAAGRQPRLLLVYGLLEAGVGVYVILFPLLFRLVQAISFRVPHGAAGVGFAFDVLLATLLIGPPTILMGGTIPILTQALARSLADATRFHAFVYAFNTAGAFAGALAAGFFLIPHLGLVRVMIMMGLVNISAGAIFILLGVRSREVVPLSGHPSATSEAEGFGVYAGAALLTGFAMMAVQTTLIRLGGLAFGSSQFTFSMVVAVFVLCIALGSFAVAALPEVRRPYLPISQWLLVAILYFLYDSLQDSPYWAHVLRTIFRDEDAAFYPYYFAVFLGVLAVIGPAVVLSGALLPLLFHQLRRELGDLGANAGKLYSWNTLGSLLGALLGGYALLFWLDLHHVYRIAVAALVIAAALVTARLYRVSRITAIAVFLIPPIVALGLLEPWSPQLLSSGLFRKRTQKEFTHRGADAWRQTRERTNVLFYDDDPTASIAVVGNRDQEGLTRSIITNGKSDGSTRRDYVTMALSGLVPAVLAGEPRRAFVIGYGTGVTVGELAALESIREVVAAEISPGVVRAAPLFDFANHGASAHPKVRIVRSDAYRALLRTAGKFDIIVSEPSNPWVTGVEMLYSREFLEVARSRLAPSGVYAQWFHQYEVDTDTLALVLRTYASVFNRVAVWFTMGPDLLLIGFNDSARALDLESLERAASRPDVAEGLRKAGVESFPALLAHELVPVGVIHAVPRSGPLHSLYHPRLSYQAGRAFFRGARARLPFTGSREQAQVAARTSLLRRYAVRFDGELPDDVRTQVLEETCRHRLTKCATLLASWANDGMDLAGLKQGFGSALEHSDQGLDWSMVTRLAPLFGDPEPDRGQRVPLESARSATQRYSTYYHHAAPFDGDTLLDLWRRCEAPPERPQACRRGLEEARSLLGDRGPS